MLRAGARRRAPLARAVHSPGAAVQVRSLQVAIMMPGTGIMMRLRAGLGCWHPLATANARHDHARAATLPVPGELWVGVLNPPALSLWQPEAPVRTPRLPGPVPRAARARNPRSPSPSPSPKLGPNCPGMGMGVPSPICRGSGIIRGHPHPRFARIGGTAEYH
jgi:hypothetical protein